MLATHEGALIEGPFGDRVGRYAATPAMRRVVERVAEDPLGRADPVEVGRHSAHLERESGAEDHAEIDVLGRGDDLIVEHEPHLAGQAVLQADEDVVGAAGVLAARHDLQRALVEALDLALVVLVEELAVVGELVQVLAAVEPVGECGVVRVEHVRAHLEADEVEQRRRRHGQAERRDRLVDGLEARCPRRPRAWPRRAARRAGG